MMLRRRLETVLNLNEAYRPALAEAGLDSLDALLRVEGADNLHKPGLLSWRTRLRLELPGPTECYLKRYAKPPLGEQLRQRLAGYRDTADAEWRWITAFAELGLPGPEAVAYGARRRGLVEQASVLVTAKVPGESLEKWAPREAGPDGRLRARRFKNELIRQSARLVARMHNASLYHQDLYLAHLFIDLPDDGDGPMLPDAGLRLTMIDLQRVVRPRLLRTKWLMKDLGALNYSTPPEVASRTDRVRWVQAYLRERNNRWLRLRPLMLLIWLKNAKIRRHDRRRRTRLSG